jgi:hypothetical protein
MAPRIVFITLIFLLSFALTTYAQNEIIETINEARQLYLQKNLSESVNYLSQALELMNKELLTQLESVFPEPLKNWRVDPPFSQTLKTAYTTSLVSKCKYYKEGGGQSVEIEIQTNAPRIANIKMAFVNPLMVKQLGEGAKIAAINDRSCIERYDSIDKFAELVFVPTSLVMITIRGHEMKNTEVVAKYAEKVKWNVLDQIFP